MRPFSNPATESNTPTKSTSTMKTQAIIVSSFLLVSSAVFAAPQKQTALPMDKRDPAPTSGRDEATKEWLRSWHKNEVYATLAEYTFEGEMEVKDTKEANWLQRRATKNVSVIEWGTVFGKSIAKTIVYHQAPQLRMSRDYQYVSSQGAWDAQAALKSETLQNAIGKAVKNDTFGRENRKAFYQGATWINPVWGTILSTWGEAGWEASAAYFQNNIGTFDEEGRLHIGTNTAVAKALGMDQHANLIAWVVTFSTNINGRQIAVAQDGRYTRRMREMKALASTDTDPSGSVEAFDSYLAQGVPANKEMEALVKRESFSVTADLFDSEVRKPGDVWAVDASFFDSFLHPDLKGSFSGTAVIRYVEDQEGDDAYFSVPGGVRGKPRAYDVRKLVVLPRGEVDGAMVSTDFAYDERPMGGRFWAKYDDSHSSVTILVDKKSGHVVFGKIDLMADEVGALPSLKLLEGFQSSGEGHLEMEFRGDVFSLDELSGGPVK